MCAPPLRLLYALVASAMPVLAEQSKKKIEARLGNQPSPEITQLCGRADYRSSALTPRGENRTHEFRGQEVHAINFDFQRPQALTSTRTGGHSQNQISYGYS